MCVEPLADFKLAVKRSISNRQASTSSSTQHSLSRQASRQDDVSAQVPGLSDYLSQFSMEDLPITGAASPLPGRTTFSSSPDVLHVGHSDDSDSEEDEKVSVSGYNYIVYRGH